MRLGKKKIEVVACDTCGQAFLSKYALKNHSCKVRTGYASRDEALARLRKERGQKNV